MKVYCYIMLLLLLISCKEKVSFKQLELSHHSEWGPSGTIIIDSDGNLIDHLKDFKLIDGSDSAAYFKYKIYPDSLQKISNLAESINLQKIKHIDTVNACPDCTLCCLKLTFSDTSVKEFIYYTEPENKDINSLDSLIFTITDRRNYVGFPIKKKLQYKTYDRLYEFLPKTKFIKPTS